MSSARMTISFIFEIKKSTTSVLSKHIFPCFGQIPKFSVLSLTELFLGRVPLFALCVVGILPLISVIKTSQRMGPLSMRPPSAYLFHANLVCPRVESVGLPGANLARGDRSNEGRGRAVSTRIYSTIKYLFITQSYRGLTWAF